MKVSKLDCPACKNEQSMSKLQISRYGGTNNLIGIILVIVALIDLVISVVSLFSLTTMSGFVSSLILLGIGVHISSSKKVWKCSHCGYFVDRHGS